MGAIRALALTAILVAVTTPAGAQSLNYPTPAVPRLADGKILPSLSHTVDRNQKLYFYYEVYDPETPRVERAVLDVAARRAAVLQFEVPAAEFQPGLYTCQVNIIDDVAAIRIPSPRGLREAVERAKS